MKQKIRKHYHWLVAFVALLSYIVFGGLTNNINAMFILPVTEELGISRSAYSLAISLRSMVTFLFNMFFGVLYRRFGYRKLALTGFTGMAVFLFGMGLASGYGGLLATIPIMGLFGVFCDTANLTQLIRNWFHRHQGMVLGLVTAASGIGGALFSLLFNALTTSFSWRISIWSASLFHLVSFGLVFLVIRSRPEERGLVPLGEEEELHSHRRKHAEKRMSQWKGLPMQELRRRPMFYLSLTAVFLSGVCCYASFYIVVPHLQDKGLSADTAASMQSTMLLALAGSKFLFGALSDRISIRKIIIFSLLCTAAGAFLITLVTGTAPALIAMILLAIGLPITAVLVPLFATHVCGTLSSDMTVGLFLSMISLSAMVMQPLMSICYDTFGSYDPALRIAAVLALGVIALYLVVFRMSDEERKKTVS